MEKEYEGIVKAVDSGVCLVIMPIKREDQLKPKSVRRIYLSLATARTWTPESMLQQGSSDSSIAWRSREFMRNLCIGKRVNFRIERTTSEGKSYGPVTIQGKDAALLAVSAGWAKVRDGIQQDHKMLLDQQEQAKSQGLGLWSVDQGVVQASKPSPKSLLAACRNWGFRGIVEPVYDGSRVQVLLLPKFYLVDLLIAGANAPSVTPDADPIALEAKCFTERLVLHRDVLVFLKGLDNSGHLVGSIYYTKESKEELLLLRNKSTLLARQLVEEGYAKYVEWSGALLDPIDAREMKKGNSNAMATKLKIWKNYQPVTVSRGIHGRNFKGKVVEISITRTGCIGIHVVTDPLSCGAYVILSFQRRDEELVYLSSVCSSKACAFEAKALLRRNLIGRQEIQMNTYLHLSHPKAYVLSYPSKLLIAHMFARVNIYLEYTSPSKYEDQYYGSVFVGDINAALLVVQHGFGTVSRQNDYRWRSNYYDDLVRAETEASKNNSRKSPTAITDLRKVPFEKAQVETDSIFLSSYERCIVDAVVETVNRGDYFELLVQTTKTWRIPFSLSCVTCPPLGAPYGDEALLLMKQNIMQRDVKIELESHDKVGGFAGSLWESDKNMEVVLLENGLAELRKTSVFTRVANYNDLVRAQETAKTKKLNMWKTRVERPVGNTKQKKELKVLVTEVLDRGRFYVKNVGDQTGLVQLCSLAYITVPSSMEADKYLSEQILKKEFSATIVLLDSEGEMINCDELGGLVCLVGANSETSINATMVQEGFGQVWEKQIDDSEEKKKALEELQKLQEEAREKGKGIWH